MSDQMDHEGEAWRGLARLGEGKGGRRGAIPGGSMTRRTACFQAITACGPCMRCGAYAEPPHIRDSGPVVQLLCPNCCCGSVRVSELDSEALARAAEPVEQGVLF